MEKEKSIGTISISHYVDCPYCGETMYDDLDKEWWNEYVTDQLPNEEYYGDKYEAVCKECKKEFVIDGFTY